MSLFSRSSKVFIYPQNKYKEAGKKELVKSLYSLLPETKETQHAKEQAQLYSEVHFNLHFSINSLIFNFSFTVCN